MINQVKNNLQMQPFTQTEQYAKLSAYFAGIKEPTVRVSNYEQTMIETIIRSQHFAPISESITAIQSYEGQLLTSADLSLVELKMQQIQLDIKNRQRYVEKLKKAIEKLETSLGMVQDYHSTAISKLQWIQSQTQKIEQERQQIEQEIEIMTCQNNNKPETKRSLLKGNKDMQQLLKVYECRNGFPRNKTQMLMHINRIEARIQHLQMNKLKNYEMSPS